ncbi:MAG: ABC transporter substrate-binding protein [Thermomicrobiales bacterium]
MSTFDSSDPRAPRSLSRRRLAQATGAIAAAGIAPTLLGTNVAAQDASPAASPEASPAVVATPDPNATFSVVSPTREEALAKAVGSTTLEEPASTGGDLILVGTSDVATLNPMLRMDSFSYEVTVRIWEPMVMADPRDGSFVPQLADSWEMSSDGMRWRFHLNPDATFHDGTPLTADDVVFSYSAITDETSLSPTRAQVMAVLAGVEKLDEHTVELTAKFPSSAFLYQAVTEVQIVPKHIWESIPFAEWGTAPGSTGQDATKVIGSGPFTFVEWVQNDHAMLARNDNYWLKDWTPTVDRFIYRVVADANSAVQSLTTGEVDICPLSPSQAVTMTRDNPDFAINAVGIPAFSFYITNMDPAHTEMFSDVKVRQALYYAIDRELLVETVYLGYATVVDSYAQTPGSPGYAPDQMETVYTYDPEKAKQLLDEAGWTVVSDGKRSKDGKPLSFEVIYDESDATDQQMIPYFQEAWGDLGIDVQTAAMPFPSIIETVNRRDYQVMRSSFGYPSPDGNTGLLFRTDSAFPAGFNLGYYSNPEFDRLDDEQLKEIDPEKRKELLVKQSNIVNNDLPWAPLVYLQSISSTHPRVHNYIPTGITTFFTTLKVWVDQG